eukprot:352094_1
MTRNVNDLLYERVCNAQSLNDIIPILGLIPMKEIQNALLDVIRGLDTNVINKVQYEGLSLTNILPDDVTQQIVSFSDSIKMKRINKAFNTCYNKNRQRELKQRQSIIDKYEFDPLVKYDERRNKTWIVHPTRTLLLNSEEIAKGYHGPFRGLEEVMHSDSVDSGDKLLFYDGRYEFTEEESSWLMGKDLQLIGIGNNVKFRIYSLRRIDEDYDGVEPVLSHPGSLYFQNITIEIHDPVCIMAGCSVSMENCTLMFSDIKVKGGTFNAKCCLFNGNNSGSCFPISISQCVHSDVNIIGCTFKNHNQTCILLDNDTSGDERTTSAIKCVANIFRNNFSYPIATAHMSSSPDKFKVKQEQTSTVMHNILEGYNGTHRRDTVDSANEIISGLWRCTVNAYNQ